MSEGTLHSAKRMVSKSEAQRVRVRGDEWRGGEAARTVRVVTMLVSQPLISLLKLEQAGLQPWYGHHVHVHAQKSHDKSVTCEISHKLIGPYVAFAAVGSAHQACTAVCRAALLAKTLFWPAAGETPPNSTRSATPLARADGIDLASGGEKKSLKKNLRTRRATHGVRFREEIKMGDAVEGGGRVTHRGGRV